MEAGLCSVKTPMASEDQRQQPLKSSDGKPSKREIQGLLKGSMATLQHLPDSLLDELSGEVLRDLSADVFPSVMEDFVDDYLTRAAIFNSLDKIVTEEVQLVLPTVLREAHQEVEGEHILEGIMSHVVEEDAKALAHSVLRHYDAEMIKVQQNQVTAFASKHLIDIYLLEHLIRLTGTADPGFEAKECSNLVLASWMFDILIGQFFSLQEQQHATFQNVPLGAFHRKAFTAVALDVILTELNKLAEEDMEDLLEYEREIQVEG